MLGAYYEITENVLGAYYKITENVLGIYYEITDNVFGTYYEINTYAQNYSEICQVVLFQQYHLNEFYYLGIGLKQTCKSCEELILLACKLKTGLLS